MSTHVHPYNSQLVLAVSSWVAVQFVFQVIASRPYG